MTTRTTPPVEFCFDLSSPWTYLAFHNIRTLAARCGATIQWTPILVGGVFNAVNQSVYQTRKSMAGPKAKHYAKSLRDWAAWTGVELVFPSQWHPLKSVNAMRAACALEDDQPQLEAFIEAAFQAYFGEARNLDDPAEIASVAGSIGIDGAALIERSQSPEIKAALRDNTDRLIARGGFGSPCIFVGGDDMYFGNDQLPLVERALDILLAKEPV